MANNSITVVFLLACLSGLCASGAVGAQSVPPSETKKTGKKKSVPVIEKKKGGDSLEEQVRKEREKNRRLKERRKRMETRLRELRVKRIEQKLGHHRYRRAFFRSTLFPGLGQWELGHKWKAGVFLGGGIILLNNVFVSLNRWRESDAAYRDQNVPVAVAASLRSTDALGVNAVYFADKRDELNTARSDVNLALLLFAGLYFYNLYDITRENPGRTEAREATRGVRFGITPDSWSGERTKSPGGLLNSGRFDLRFTARF